MVLFEIEVACGPAGAELGPRSDGVALVERVVRRTREVLGTASQDAHVQPVSAAEPE
jgi:hypothetical protein